MKGYTGSAFGGSKQSVPAMHPYRRAFQLGQLTEGNEEFEQKLAKATKLWCASPRKPCVVIPLAAKP